MTMATTEECMTTARELLRLAGIAPEAWSILRVGLKRAALGRVLDTNDSAAIDRAMRLADYCFARGTGDLGTGVRAGAMATLLILGGAAIGVAATLKYQELTEDD